MRRAGQKRIVSSPTTSLAPPPGRNARRGAIAELDIAEPIVEPPADEATIRRRQLPTRIRKRIESRLAGRVRNLAVRVAEDTVVLEGQCATYYTKQLAQHAALGILEDEHLDNAIVVDGHS